VAPQPPSRLWGVGPATRFVLRFGPNTLVGLPVLEEHGIFFFFCPLSFFSAVGSIWRPGFRSYPGNPPPTVTSVLGLPPPWARIKFFPSKQSGGCLFRTLPDFQICSCLFTIRRLFGWDGFLVPQDVSWALFPQTQNCVFLSTGFLCTPWGSPMLVGVPFCVFFSSRSTLAQ